MKGNFLLTEIIRLKLHKYRFFKPFTTYTGSVGVRSSNLLCSTSKPGITFTVVPGFDFGTGDTETP